ncbi:META domain-containing protein [Sphingobacterium faecium]|uniref:META domain-containing protein n=1 Tax=Sphingobacterium faecium TaxID=34087 RepID=UPI001291F049|nr:META domain-containing protein [Sphingobacterium faecium]MQP28492.1 META domain-containing protein [Sphingobacterium faecium]
MKFNQILIMATLILGLSSCSIYKKNTNKETSTTETMQLKGNKWQLIEVDGKTVPSQVNGRVPFLQFEDNRYAANAGCNTLGGVVNISGKNKIKFEQGISTMMACPEFDIEQSLSKAIIAVDSYTIAGEILSLNKSGKTLAKFALIKPEKGEQALSGTWELDYISGPRIAFQGLYPNEKPSITFDLSTKKVSGNSSCNNYNGTFKTENNHISFGPLASTKMACEGSGESVYFSTLGKITSFDVNGTTLTLIMGDIAMMRFQKK